MTDNKSRIYQRIPSILPEHISSTYQNFVDFLKQYYISQEYQGGVVDIVRSIDSYKKPDTYTNEVVSGSTVLSDNIDQQTTTIRVESTNGWPKEYGLLKIGDEIIHYTSATNTTFEGCIRGFSGIDSLHTNTQSDRSNFSKTTAASHSIGSTVTNLNTLLAKELYRKFKHLYAPGIGDRDLNSTLDQKNFLKQVRDFYQSKGTDESVKILFRSVFGEEASVIKPQEYLLSPSDSDYDVVEKLVCRSLSGNPLKIKGGVLIQENNPDNQNINFASASITDVESLSYNLNLSGRDIIKTGQDNTNVPYYLISLSSGYGGDITTNGTIEGNFSITPKTLTTQFHSRGDVKTITVDSTISFPKSGYFYIEDEFESIKIGYRTKNINQFLDCFSPDESREILPRNFVDGCIVRGDHTVFSYEDNDVTKKVELVITGVLDEYESGGISKLSGKVISETLNVSGFVNGSGYISGPNSIFGTGVIGGTGTELDGLTVSGKILGIIDGIKIKGTISETGIPDLDGTVFDGEFLEVSSLPQNILENDPIRIKSIGKIQEEDNYFFSSWMHNVSNRSRVKTIDAASLNSVKFTTYDKHQFRLDDKVELIDVITNNIFAEGTVTFLNNQNTVTVDMPSDGISDDREWDVRRKILFGFTNNEDHRRSDLNTLISDVQNTYTDNNNLVYVASESIPSYEVTTGKNIREFTSIDVIDSRILIPDHGFFSGDGIFYTPKDRTTPLAITGPLGEFDVSFPPLAGISTGFYYVIRYDDNTIGLTLTRNGVRFNDFVTITSNNNPSDIHQLIPSEYAGKSIKGQKLLKAFPLIKETPAEIQYTKHGAVGMFVNGIEILNYKSPQRVHYGRIESINVLNGGENYDVVNLPSILIEDENGQGAEARPSINGKVVGIAITDTGFDIIGEPKITLTGGNGSGCILKAKLNTVSHEVFFNASPTGYVSVGSTISVINTVNNTLRFENKHKFRNGDKVIYNSYGNKPIQVLSGVSTQLVSNSSYYVSIISSKEFSIHEKEEDAINGINAIDIVGFGTGLQSFKSIYPKKIISDVIVVNSGQNYRNKERVVRSNNTIGINTVYNLINIVNHDYENGDIVVYRCGVGSTGSIGGLIHNENYIVTVYDENNFRLSQVGINSEIKEKYYLEKKYISFTDFGYGDHIFNYPDIQLVIEVDSNIPLENGGQAYGDPIVRGEINSVSILSGGSGYGSQENVINLDTTFIPFPKVRVSSGSGAVVQPIIQDGIIKYVIVKDGGIGYTSPPDLEIQNYGEGVGAELVSVIKDGVLESVNVISGGLGYSDFTAITVKEVGSGCILKPSIQTWTINLFERNKDRFKNDDGFIIESSDSELELKYGSLYPPRNLRKILKTNSGLGKNSDLEIDPNQKVEIDRSGDNEHSPIIGWAYDGNPIYGPYGYVTTVGGGTTLLKSGYKQIITIGSKRSGGPDTDIFPPGFFIEDYEYQGTGDLDIHNGRFCVTPEFPNGVYAYFCTFSQDVKGPNTRFSGFKQPVFPYVIGDSFYSKPFEDNLKYDLNQTSDRFNKLNIIRNTYPYKFGKTNSVYEYCVQPQEKTNIESRVTKTTRGSIDSVEVISPGQDYSIGDKVILDMSNTGSSVPVSLEVGSIIGVGVSSISYEQVGFNDVVLSYSNNKLTGITTEPHNLKSNDVIEIFDANVSFNQFEGLKKIIVPNISSNLRLSVGSTVVTGIVTTIYLNSSVSAYKVGKDDIIGIGDEELKILNIDEKENSLTVKRLYRGTTGSSYGIGDLVTLKSRSFVIYTDDPKKISSNIENKKFNFNPQQTVGVGTVGISTSLIYISLGSVVDREVKTQSIYIPNHSLKTGQRLLYSFDDGTSLGVSTNTDPSNIFTLENNTEVYAVNLGTNYVGISTSKIGLGTDGSYVGVNTTQEPYLLYFNDFGTGSNHSLETIISEPKCKIRKHIANVQTISNHFLEDDDQVYININVSSESNYEIEYNSYINKLIVDPKETSGLNIDIENNTIEIENHGFNTGDEILYESTNVADPLQNNEVYYAIKVTDNLFKLAYHYYDSQIKNPITVSFDTVGGTHKFGKVNPKLEFVKYSNIGFGVSHPSLKNLTLKFFKDSEFAVEFGSTQKNSEQEIIRVGRPGLDSNAKITLLLNENFDNTLYYQIVPTNVEEIKINREFNKLSILPNKSVKTPNTNKLELVESEFNGSYNIVKTSDSTFSYSLHKKPESNSYSQFDIGLNEYYVTRTNTYEGPIKSIRILEFGKNLIKAPKFITINSTNGFGADIIVSGRDIGRIKNVELNSIGFEFNSDKTLKPIADVPSVIQLDEFYKLKSIDVRFGGQNYLRAPDIIFYNRETGIVNPNIITNASLVGSSVGSVEIVNGGFGLSKTQLTALSINNDNGVIILDASYNNSTQTVTLRLETPPIGFTTETFPFSIGDQVFVEGVSIASGTGSGYNSSDYGYRYFTIDSFDPSIGVENNATISYQITGITTCGVFSPSFGRVVGSKNLPIFDLNYSDGSEFQVFLKNELITFDGGNARVIENSGWDDSTLTLRVNRISGEIQKNSLIESNTTGAIAKVKDVKSFDGFYGVSEMTTKPRGSLKETGKIGQPFQRLHDNNYYQKFSYSIKSTINTKSWDEVIDSLTHTAGYKKFSDLNILSSTIPSIASFAATTTTLVDLSSVQDVERIHDYDLVSEDFNGSCSKNVFFNGKQLTDLFRSDKNRVIIIDDISLEFRSNADNSVYTVIDSFFGNTLRTCKYIIQFYDPRKKSYEIAEFLLVHNNFDIFINDYTGTYNNLPFGSLDAFVERGFIEVRFTPYDQNTDIYIKAYRIAMRDDLTSDAIDEVGFVDRISSTENIVLQPEVPVRIVGIDSNRYTSLNFIAQVGTASSNYLLPSGSKDYLSVEGNILVEQDNDLIYSDYGIVHTFRDLGEFGAEVNSLTGEIDINFTLNAGIGTTTAIVNLYAVGITTSNVLGITSYITPNPDDGNGSVRVRTTYVSNPSFTQIPSPEVLILSNDKREHRSIKYFIEVTNADGERGTVTLNCIHDGTDAFVSRYGYTYFNEDILGEFDVRIVGDDIRLIHIPPYNIETEVKVYSEEFEISSGIGYTTFGITDILVGDYVYEDRINRYKYSFNLKHNTDSIFSKQISNIGIATTSSTIAFIKEDGTADDHFFVTGEELTYDYLGISTERITISPVSITGVGLTDKLPDTVFAIKVNENTIQLSTSRSDALSGIAITIVDYYEAIDSISEIQTLDALDANKKCILQIDNIIQQPLTRTSIYYNLNENIGGATTTFNLTGITSIRNGDIIKIDNEYMYVSGTNFPNLNDVIVRRSWMGTNLDFNSSHVSGSVVRLYRGDYNIVKDVVYFKDAPYGSNTVGADFLAKSNIRASSSFQGRFFQKSSYDTNVIFDDISSEFSGIGKTFTLKVDGEPLTGIAISESNSVVLINNIFQKPGIDYNIDENIGVSTDLVFYGRNDIVTGTPITSDIDVNKNDIPRGGIIISVGSSQGYGYQPLIRASGISSVSIAGTVTNVNIGTSYYAPGMGYTDYTFPGSGYTQEIVNIYFEDPENNGSGAEGYGTVNAGIVTNITITSGGIGYTSSNPPKVTFDSPIGYINLPLTGSLTGIGASATVVVGQGSSVIDFQITNKGYNYKIGDILTPVGIPTSLNAPYFEPFQITVNDVWYDKFSSWNVGNLELLVDISPQFNNVRRSFVLERQGDVGVEPLSIEKGDYGAIDLAANLLVLLDGVIQQPRKDYNFDGGTTITFTEAPKSAYSCLIFFYRGDVNDTFFSDIDPPIEIGDAIQLYKAGTELFQENENIRTIVGINSSNSVKTGVYCGRGQSGDESILRPAHLIRQRKDIYNSSTGEYESKKRLIQEANIRPTSTLIRSIADTDTVLFVDSLTEYFNSDLRPENDVKIVSQEEDYNVDYIEDISVSGGHGNIIGIGTSTTGIGTDTPMVYFNLKDSGSLGTISSGIESGVYFVVYNSNVGTGLTSIEIVDSQQTIIGVGTTFIDNIYRVDSLYDNGLGDVIVYCNVLSISGISSYPLTGIATDGYYFGSYSWGRIQGTRISNSKNFTSYSDQGLIGLTTSPTVTRLLPYKIDF